MQFSRNKITLTFLSLFILLLCCSNTAYSFVDFEDIRKQTLSNKEIDSHFVEKYLGEIKTIQGRPNPTMDPSTTYVWVLSGRSSYLKEHVDGPDVKDLEDDYHRLNLGIQVARGVVQKLSGKTSLTEEDVQKYGPQIIYNGRPKHNEDLKIALKEGLLTHYPLNKFLILDLDPKEWNSRGQFMSFKKEVPTTNTSVAIVTHAYHGPRILRMIESQWNPFGVHTAVSLYLVDREFTAPGIQEDLLGEMKRIPTYIKQGDLTQEIPEKVRY